MGIKSKKNFECRIELEGELVNITQLKQLENAYGLCVQCKFGPVVYQTSYRIDVEETYSGPRTSIHNAAKFNRGSYPGVRRRSTLI